MHWNTGGFEELKGLPGKEQLQVVARAVKAFAPAVQWRFYVSIPVFFLACPALLESMDLVNGIATYAVPLISLLGFYLYLLWEINGAIHTAVQTYQRQSEK